MTGDIRQQYQGKTIVITGGYGYVGAKLAQTLLSIPCHLILLDREIHVDWLPQQTTATITSVAGDVADPKVWQDITTPIDYTFHLAAIEPADLLPVFTQALEVNTVSILHMMQACSVQPKAPRIVFASSANVFGQVQTVPVNETVVPNPAKLWSVTKLAAEHCLSILSQQYQIPSATLRLANVYGPSISPEISSHVVVNKVAQTAIAGKPLTLFSNKDCRRDHVYLDDVIAAFLHAGIYATSTASPMYVIGSEEDITIAKVWSLLAQCVHKYTGTKVPITVNTTVPIGPSELRHFVADSKKFKTKAHWRPQTKIRKGLAQTVESLLG